MSHVHDQSIVQELQTRLPDVQFTLQATQDGIPTLWVSKDRVREVLRCLKQEVDRPYRMLFDLTGIDERLRTRREGQPASDFTVVYHLLSFDRNSDARIKVPLQGEYPSVHTVTGLWPNANWYERELWDMFGIGVEGHPNLRRILLPNWWKGHPLRKDHPSRGTEMEPYLLTEVRENEEDAALEFRPEDWGMTRHGDDEDFLFLNLGPQHPGTHGPFRVMLQLDGEEIVDCVPDIGFHHRGQDKIAERQNWHTYLPYTDRIDYVSGVVNEIAYLTSLEQLAGIEVPDRARVIRVMLTETFRIISHLVWYGTFAQDLGALSPVFYMFNDRERAFQIVEAITGFRMHPGWFRIGGVAADLPRGWERLVRDFVDYLPPKLREYDRLLMQNRIFKGRTQDIGKFTLDEAMEWGATGPMLRACGLEWDMRKKRPYSGYDQFDFEIPTATHGDAYDRAVVHVEEMRQSIRIIEQCMNNMPEGPYKSDHPLTTPPVKWPNTMYDIETLIDHFLQVSYGPVMPPGEVQVITEASKGMMSFYLISDGNIQPYRSRSRTPSFPHLQMIPLMTRGYMVPDLVSTLGSIDFVLSDVDR
jgi:NADH-quinone oxidoreductase subunit C/D